MQLGLGPFTDLTLLEFNDQQAQVDQAAVVANEEDVVSLDVGNLPGYVNWVHQGAVNPPRNQGDKCGSCWAFAAVSAIESANQILTGELLDLSEQELVDCDRSSYGCRGVLSALDTVLVSWACSQREIL